MINNYLKIMIPDWNFPDKLNSVTIARLISELEGCAYLLSRMEEMEDYDIIDLLRKKYYKLYFQLHKSEKNDYNSNSI